MFRVTIVFVACLMSAFVCAGRVEADVAMMRIESGNAPGLCPRELVSAVKKLTLVHGMQFDGFGSISANLYGRGTQEEIQSLLDALGDSEIEFSVNINRSGKVGLLKANKIAGPKRAMWYVFSLSFYKQHKVQPNVEPQLKTSLTVFSAAGVDPDRLKLPSNAKRLSSKPTLKISIE